MKSLIKATFAISTTEVVLMAVALLKNKYLAVTIGPEGFGIYGLLNSFFSFISVFSGGWLAAGIVKYISEYSDNKNRLSFIYSFSVILTSLLSITIIIVFLIFHKFIISVFLSKDVSELYFVLFSVSFLGNSLHPVYANVLQGLSKIKSIVSARLILSIFDIIFTLLLVYLFHLTGFFISIIITSIAVIIIFSFYINKEIPIIKKLDYDREITKKLMVFGGVNFFLTFSNLGVEYLQRGIIVKYIDLSAVGVFTAAMAIVKYMQLFSRGSGFYFMPEMSKIQTDNKRIIEIDNMLLFNSIIYAVIVIIVIMFSSLIINILFSREFSILKLILPFFSLGIFLRSISGVMNTVIYGMAKLKAHSIITITQLAVYIGISSLLIKDYGLTALGYAYLFSSIVSVISTYIAVRNNIRNYNPIKKYHYILLVFVLISQFISNVNIIIKIIYILLVILICYYFFKKRMNINIKMILK